MVCRSLHGAAASSVLGTWTLAVVRALDARGIDGRSVAARAGIDVADLDDPDARYPIAATTRLWHLGVEATRDPCFGLWASRFVTQTTFHALGFAVFASRTLRDAFERFVRYGHTTYRQALNDTRQQMARAHLEEGRASVTEIAFLLGFADPSSFSRAFRRWTGESPRAYTQHRTCNPSKGS